MKKKLPPTEGSELDPQNEETGNIASPPLVTLDNLVAAEGTSEAKEKESPPSPTPLQPVAKAPVPPSKLSIELSHSLYKKLVQQAEEEGISLAEYATELLAESAVLRAWEIVEKKSHLRGQNPNAQPPQNQGGQPRRGNNNRQGNNAKGGGGGAGGGGGNNRRGMSQSRYQAIMDDKATFLEYVRNQERKRR